MLAVLAAVGVWAMPPQTIDFNVYDHGRKLVRRYDPAPDTCVRQWAFTRPHSHRVIAEDVECFGGTRVYNFTRHQLSIRYTTAARWLDPIDEVAPEVCENHGVVIGAMAHGKIGIAWCGDGTLQRFTL